MSANREGIVGVVLAGGASRRMAGRMKATLAMNGEPLVARAVRRLRPQVERVVVNANDSGCEGHGDALVSDAFPDRRGPLAGVLAAMDWTAENEPDARHVASVAVDTPFFPPDLVARLRAACPGGGIALVEAGGRPQPTLGLWPVRLRAALRAFLETEGSRKILHFTDAHGPVGLATLPEAMVENVNTPEEWEAARARLAANA